MGKPAIYLRVSSDIQRDKNSIESQAEAMTTWLASQGLTPEDVIWYRDDGVSGKDSIAGRGDGARAMGEYEAVADTDDPAIQRQVIDRFIAELRASYVDGTIHREVYWSV